MATKSDLTYAAAARDLVAPFVAADLFAGSVLVAKAGEILLRDGFGLADREWNVPNGPTGKFRIGSLTKQFTATAILQLMERGKLALEDPVARHCPEAPDHWRAVTLLHLLTHSSGIPSYTSLPAFFRDMAQQDRSPREIIALTERAPLDFEPGTQFKYNNGAFIILGLIVERLSGLSYEDYLRQNILLPLGLASTGYEHLADIVPERVRGYRYRRGGMENAPYLAMSLPYAAGSIYSTVDDLLAWQRALTAARPISPSSVELMFADHGHGYGFGWGIQNQFARRQFVHAGGINGFSTVLSHYPDEDLTIILLANIQASPVQKIARDLAALHFGVAEHEPDVVLDAALLADYVGTYRLGPERILRVTQEGARLFIEGEDLSRQELAAKDDHSFLCRMLDFEVRFEADGVEQASRLLIRRNGKEAGAERIASLSPLAERGLG
ncbi:MAG TPA: serine hydrolase domain-containing protein [Methylovirgula sp.]|nr:serine hydrolase domain-containing protein [Methylovirgula sp.]